MSRIKLLGVGAMRSPRFAPAGLLVECGPHRAMIDGGPGAEPEGPVDAWLVTDLRAELIREIRALARPRHVEPEVRDFVRNSSLRIQPEPVVHTSHPTFGYRIGLPGCVVVWAPEFLEFPKWAEGADLLFADGAGWARPIRFRGGGGHACVLDVAREAQRHGVHRLVFAHIGRPTLRAVDAGDKPPFGEIGHDGQVFHGPELAAPSRRRREGGRPASATVAVPDVVAPDLDVIFVGINPDPVSGERRHHFANSRNSFWRLLHEAGFTPRQLDPSAEAYLLELGLGVTNLVSRVARSSSELTPLDFSRGRQVLARKIALWRPRAVVLVGQTVWRALSGTAAPASRIELPARDGTRVFVVPNPSGRNAAYSYREMLRKWRSVARALDRARPDRRHAAGGVVGTSSHPADRPA
jgi:G:T/U-mismatch repair DNA glycosylase